MNPPESQSPVEITTPVFPVALLIDGENVIAPDLIAHILVEAGKMGGVIVRHVYGNWATPSMQPWKKIMPHYTLEPMGNRSGHNATDIALVIAAMDLLYQGIKHFCLVAGDSDYVPLVERLRKAGCVVLVIGTPSVSTALKEASSKFLSTEQLIPPLKAAPAPSQVPWEMLSEQTTTLSDALIRAYQAAREQSETEWVLLSALGLTLRQLYPDYHTTNGKQRLAQLLKQYPDLFETRQRAIGKGQASEVRLQENSDQLS